MPFLLPLVCHRAQADLRSLSSYREQLAVRIGLQMVVQPQKLCDSLGTSYVLYLCLLIRGLFER